MKKAQLLLGTLAKLAILLVVVFLLITYWSISFANASRITSRAECATSIQVRAISGTLAPLTDKSPFELSCPRKLVHITQDEMRQSNRRVFETSSLFKWRDYEYVVADFTEEGNRVQKAPEEEITADQVAFEERLNEIFAYELAECWELFAGLERDLLDSQNAVFDGNVCVKCSTITVDRQHTARKSTLLQHLSEKPHVLFNHDEFYSFKELIYNPLNPSEPDVCIDYEALYTDLTIAGGGQSYDVFLLRRGNTLKSLGIATLNAFRENELRSCQTLGVIQSQDLSRICDAVVG